MLDLNVAFLKFWFLRAKPVIVAVVFLIFLYVFIFNVTSTVQVAVLTAAFSLYGIVINHNKNQEREINAKHFSEKLKAYTVMIDYIFDMYKGVKFDSWKNSKKNIENFINVKKQMMIWGSTDAIKALDVLEGKSGENKSAVEFVLALENLMLALRKDLGHNDSRIQQGDLITMIVSPEDKKFMESIRSFKK